MFRFFFRCGNFNKTPIHKSVVGVLAFGVCQVLGVGKVAVKLRGGAAKSGQVPTLQQMVR